MKRFFAMVAVVAALVAIPSPAAAAGVTCSYKGTTHQVTVTISGASFTAYLARDVSGHITVGGVWCANVATVTNTDTIVVNGDANAQNITVNIGNGGFQPGFTDEAGNSDEIEFTIDAGGGTETLAIFGTEAVDRIDLGQNTTQLGVVRRINLNAGEGTGDSDMAVTNVESITVYGAGSGDIIRGRGKAGTGPDPINLPLTIFAGPGNDKIKGGEATDHIVGDFGMDTIYGFGGADSIDMDDGVGGDVGYGGTGVDTVVKNAGDTWTQ